MLDFAASWTSSDEKLYLDSKLGIKHAPGTRLLMLLTTKHSDGFTSVERDKSFQKIAKIAILKGTSH